MEPPEKGKGGKGPQGNTDAYKRMNFLLQAAQLCSYETPQLSRFYVNSLRAISEKQLIRLDASIKEEFCKFCNTWMIPGETKSVRMAPSRQTHLVWRCEYCGFIRRVPVAARDPETRRESTTTFTHHVYPPKADPAVYIAPPRKRKDEPPKEPQISKRRQKRMWAQQKREQEEKEKLQAAQEGETAQPSSSSNAAQATPAAPPTETQGTNPTPSNQVV
eukprot:TRINITY_DN12509_c0_g1_i1.p1 TRINITY_DN12509_c0_g1~~TRINITY_DN12509_c0_g1_i1.p1  ORF type:complete len:218 (-),score=29.35 TRINITY_DN12509_c0_g1_i1:46-699(-)